MTLAPNFFDHTLQTIQATQTIEELEAIRVAILGKRGTLTEEMKNLGTLTGEERRNRGIVLNTLKQQIESALEIRKHYLEAQDLEAQIHNEWQDITLPIRLSSEGKVHPITQVKEEVLAFFTRFGFSLEEGPEVESIDNNFTALNIPKHHPARQMHDTFYLNSRKDQNSEPYLLRTHTSNVQIRTLRQGTGPFRFLAIGRVYRSDYDMTHTPMFHQIDAVALEKGLHMGHLKGILTDFLQTFFGIKNLSIRFRPSFFPFTEPSAEVDIGYTLKDGKLILGGEDNWLEILGCGMIHPTVLHNCNIDPSQIEGFAFGMGLERIAMLKYGIPDLRSFFESDLRWLKHYGFSCFSSPSLFGSVVR